MLSRLTQLTLQANLRQKELAIPEPERTKLPSRNIDYRLTTRRVPKYAIPHVSDLNPCLAIYK